MESFECEDDKWMKANKDISFAFDELKELIWQGNYVNNDEKMFTKTYAVLFLYRYSRIAAFNESTILWCFDIFMSYFLIKNYSILYNFLKNILQESLENKKF